MASLPRHARWSVLIAVLGVLTALALLLHEGPPSQARHVSRIDPPPTSVPAAPMESPSFSNGPAAGTDAPPGRPAVQESRPLPEASDSFADAVTISVRETPPDAQGRVTRIRIVKTDFKYPFVRIVETVERDPIQGVETVLRRIDMVADHILVKLRPGMTEDDLEALNLKFGTRILKKMLLSDIYLVELEGHDLDAVTRAVESFTREAATIACAEPDGIAHITAVTPNDPRYPEQWSLNNTGQTGGGADADIDAPEAWSLATGSLSVKVGIIDTGVDYNHEDLAANMWTNPGEIAGNGIDDDHNGYVDDVRGWDFSNEDNNPMDDHGHGTHVGGTIGGIGNNGIGVTGVCWKVTMVAIKAFNSRGEAPDSDIIESVSYGTTVGAHVLSNSYGDYVNSQLLRAEIVKTDQAGIVFVAAAGNAGGDSDWDPQFPASFDVPNIIAVAATDPSDQLTWFSNYGLTSVHLGAPGLDILSCKPGNEYQLMSGTSMATPHVSGVCALMKAHNPALTNAQIKELLLASTDHIPALAGKCTTGGRMNASKAVLMSSDPDIFIKKVVILDDGTQGTHGNGDGTANPGERIGLQITLFNSTLTPIAGVSGSLAMVNPSPSVSVVGGTASFGSIPAGQGAAGSAPYLIDIQSGAPSSTYEYRLTVTDNAGHTWTPLNAFTVYTSVQIQGTVTLDGSPVSGASVDYSGLLVGTVQTGADGKYIIHAVSGAYSLKVRKTGLITSDSRSVSAASSVSGVDFKYVSVPFSGLVTDSGAPLAGATVIVKVAYPLAIRGTIYASATTGSDGRYSLTFAIEETGKLFVVDVQASKPLSYGNSDTKNFSIPPGAAGVDFQLTSLPLGTLWTWGYNVYGELGDGTNSASLTPNPVSGLSDVKAMAGGYFHSMALRNDGTVWTWGNGDQGQLGNGTVYTSSKTPVQVSTLAGVVGIAAGCYHDLAIKSDGTVWAWGSNENGQITGVKGGGPNGGNYATPVQLTGLTGVSKVAGSYSWSMALKGDGSVWEWGSDAPTQAETEDKQAFPPKPVAGLSSIVSMATGWYHAIALKSDGTVWSWGANGFGQLGDGTLDSRATPAQVSGLSGVIAVETDASQRSYALKSDGTVWAWGNNHGGYLGVTDSPGVLYQPTPAQVMDLNGVKSIAGSLEHCLALRSDGTVWGWGANQYGQLGDGTKIARIHPAQSPFLKAVPRMAAGYGHSMVLYVAVSASPHPPVANGQSVEVVEDTPKDLTLSASDADGDLLAFVVVSPPSHGTLSGMPPALTYTPDPDYFGADSFTFKANDGTTDSNIATVSITVTPVNDAPEAQNQSISVVENTSKDVTLSANDVDGDSLTFTTVSSPSHGTLSGTAPALTYTPATDYTGADSFTFKANDGSVDSNIATVSITVTPVGGGPGPEPTTYTLTVNSGSGDGTYEAGTEVTITANAAPAGKVFDRWTGDTGALASATSATTTVTMPAANVTVTATYVDETPDPEPGNEAPVGTIDLDFEGPLTGTFTIAAPGVLANDTDPDGDALTAVLVNDYIVGVGNLTLNANGSFTIEITYSSFKDGDVIAFTYKAVDPSGARSAETTALITLRASIEPDPEPTTYTLTVNSGSGDGSYEAGDEVSITADAAPAGQVFDRWTGDTAALASATSATTTVTMPADDVTVTATYVDESSTTYTLTVNSGTGDGSYEAGDEVSITADAAPAGQVFDRWTGDTAALASATSATTTVTMPAGNVTVTATYVDESSTTYTLTVNSGSGDGSYEAGDEVSITADAAPAGQVFDRWTGDTAALASATSATTIVTMPADDVTVTATYASTQNASDLVGHWKVDESNTGLPAFDSSGSFADGTYMGDIALSADVPAPIQSFSTKSVSVNGINGAEEHYIQLPNDVSALQDVYKGEYTIMCWYKPAVLPKPLGDGSDPEAAHGLLCQGTGNQGLWYWNNGGHGNFMMEHWTSDGTHMDTYGMAGDNRPPGSWYHVAGAVGKSVDPDLDPNDYYTMIWINGEVMDKLAWGQSGSPMGPYDRADAPWKIGIATPPHTADYSWAANGLIDDVRIYKRVLTDAEVAHIAAGLDTGGSGDGTPAPEPDPQPVPAPQIGMPDLPGIDPDGNSNGDHTINDTLCGGTIGGSGWPGLWMFAVLAFAFQARRPARR